MLHWYSPGASLVQNCYEVGTSLVQHHTVSAFVRHWCYTDAAHWNSYWYDTGTGAGTALVLQRHGAGTV